PTLTLAATNTVQDFLDAVNNTANLNVRAGLSSDGMILLEATRANTIVIGGTASAAEKAQFGLVDDTTAAGTVNATRASLASQYDNLRAQIDKLAQDAGFNGVDLLYCGRLKVTFSEQSTPSPTIAGVTLDFGAPGSSPAARC